MTITKDNLLDYILHYNDPKAALKELVSHLKRLCKIAPEFSHEPRMAFEKVDQWDAKMLVFSNLDGFEMRVYASWFCLDDRTFKDDVVSFDLDSFGIKKASQNRINKISGCTCY